MDSRGHYDVHGAETRILQGEPWILAFRERFDGNERQRKESIFAVHHWLQQFAPGWIGQLAPSIDGGPEGGRWRRFLPFGEHLRPLPQTTGLSE